MRPFLILGSSDKARYDWALQVAHENNYHFIQLFAKEFSAHEKDYFTSSLDQALCLFYLEDAQKLTIDESQRFLDMVKNSPHIFILSASSFEKYNYVLQKQCLVKPLGDFQGEFSSQIKILMTESDRNAVRLALTNADVKHLFETIKFDAWKSPEVLPILMRINQNLFKVRTDYILSLLAFALSPNKAFAVVHHRKQENKLQKSILVKLAKAVPSYTSSEVADVFHLIHSLHSSLLNIELTDEEKQFLGFNESDEATQEVKVFLKTAELSEYF